MTPTYSLSYRTNTRIRGFLAMVCLVGLLAVPAGAITPCSAPTSAGFQTVTVLLNNTQNGNPGSFVAGDFNNDGITDAVVPIGTSASINDQIFNFRGQSSTGLVLAGSSNTLPRPTDSVATDFNNDGKLDLVITTDVTIQTLLGDGLGNFSSVATYSVNSYHLAAADFNNDGKSDIAATAFGNPGRVSILNGFGTGTFAAPVDTPTGDSPVDLKAADMNGDGKPDLLTVGTLGVSVLLNTGTGFSLPTNFASGVGLASKLAVGDFNNDGKRDVAVANQSLVGVPYAGPSFSVLLGNGMGSLGAPTTFDLGVNFVDLAAGDFNGDGNIDLAALNQIHQNGPQRPSNMVLLAGNGAGNFSIANTTGLSYYSRSLTAGDFNNDGRLDLVAANGPRTTGLNTDVTVLTARCRAPRINGDYDGDGKADYAVWRPSTGTWRILQSSDGTLRTQPWGGDAFGDIPAPGDYDGDGKADIAVFRNSTGAWYILRSSDNGVFATSWGSPGDRPVPGDYDGDRKTDIAIYRPSTGTWWVLRSSDNTYFGAQFGISTDKTAQGDYDGDGKTDLAVFRTSQGVWYVINSGDNSFSATYWGNSSDVPAPGDYDGDGRNDLAVYRPSSGHWYIYKPDAAAQYVELFTGASLETPAPADYDGDGLTDVAVWRPAGKFELFNSFTGNFVVSPVVGSNSDVPVSMPYAPY